MDIPMCHFADGSVTVAATGEALVVTDDRIHVHD